MVQKMVLLTSVFILCLRARSSILALTWKEAWLRRRHADVWVAVSYLKTAVCDFVA